MSDTENRSAVPQLQSGPLITGAVLVGAGAMLVLAGIAVGSSHLFSATRRWVQDMETPPSELAKQNWERAKTAARAGATAWQDGTQVSERVD
ncbi:MAG TPA: hypothetical protein VGS19_09785 [Streptosporangiaceae bacterium]|nr:hypothetical protein [Streptosporangiaceae bacterium]